MHIKENIHKALLCLGALASLGFAAIASANNERGDTAVGSLPTVVVPDTPPIIYTYDYADNANIVNSAANVIIDSTRALEPFMCKLQELRSGANKTVSVLHIGDSHLQADFWSGHVRELIQADFGNAGRGLITPYKLAGTNEPRNYSIQTPLSRFTYKGTERGLKEMPGVTGVAVAFEGQDCAFNIWSKGEFNTVTVLHHPAAPMLTVSERFDMGMHCTYDDTPTATRIALNQLTDTLVLRGKLTNRYNNPTFYGFSLENGRPGVLYHMIGLNGAAFEHIADHTTLLEGGAKDLNPDLIVVSLGVNNCFGSGYRPELFRKVVDRFVGRLTEAYPGCAILLTTPIESCSRPSRRAAYRVNPNVADVARAICETAREYDVACWDMYAAAGGEGSNAKWYAEKLIRDDRLHFSERGYTLLGDMLYGALADYYNNRLAETARDTQLEK